MLTHNRYFDPEYIIFWLEKSENISPNEIKRRERERELPVIDYSQLTSAVEIKTTNEKHQIFSGIKRKERKVHLAKYLMVSKSKFNKILQTTNRKKIQALDLLF